MKLMIQRYSREAGVRDLERNLASLARAAAVKVAEREHLLPLSKDMHQFSSSLLESRVAEGAEVEIEVIPMGHNHETSNEFRVTSPLIVDEDILEKVLGVPKFPCLSFKLLEKNVGSHFGVGRTLKIWNN